MDTLTTLLLMTVFIWFGFAGIVSLVLVVEVVARKIRAVIQTRLRQHGVQHPITHSEGFVIEDEHPPRVGR